MDYIEFLKNKKGIALNEQQTQAVLQIEGPCLLLAVPGSGKTTVVVARIGNLLMTHHVMPEQILNISFSVDSAKDMGRRFASIFEEIQAYKLQFRTIHSLCFKVIKDFERLYKRNSFEVLDQITPVIRSILIGHSKKYPTEDTIQGVIQKITYVKNMMFDESQIETVKITDCDFQKVYKAYEAHKLQNKLMDYDDMLLYAYKILSTQSDILELYHNQFKYINVDEAQDISVLQHRIIHLLAQKNKNLFLVGDEDQSIYGFRAAYPKELLEFKKIYPDAVVLKMEQNFRSSQTIVAAANQIISSNQERFNKQMYTENDQGLAIKQTAVKDLNSQYQYLSDQFKSYDGSQSIAILFRNNESVIPLFDVLERDKRAFSFKQSTGAFFSHFIIKDISCFMRLSFDPGDFDAFEKIYYKLKCGLTKDILASLVDRTEYNLFDAVSNLETVNEAGRKRIVLIKDRVSKLREFHAVKAIEIIEKEIGYTSYLTKLSKSGFSLAFLQQKLNALKSIALKCQDPEAYLARMVELEEKSKDPIYNTGKGVILSTIHSSKGLEFDKVILVDIIEGVIPSSESLANLKLGEPALYEEEVRLFYVGLTRARHEVEVITGKTLNRHAVQQSVFIDELFPKTKSNRQSMKSFISLDKKTQGAKLKVASDDNEALYEIGTKVKHKAFGEGIIESMEDEHIEVAFRGGVKRISLQVCIDNGLIKRIN